MRLVNYQEDIVLHIAEIVLQDRPDVEFSQELLLDTAAYVLNRLPPRYIVSERGFTRLMAELEDENESKLENLVELLLLINSAVDIVKKRRSSVAKDEISPEETEEEDHVEPHWHNIPYLIGRVVDGGDRKPVAGVKITLLANGSQLKQAGNGWTNPYVTSLAAHGFYSFLPAPIHSEDRMRNFDLQLLFEINGYRNCTLKRNVKTSGELAARLDFSNDGFINLGTTLLEKTPS